MDEKLAPGASGGHGARWPPCHGYGTERKKLRIETVNVETLRGRLWIWRKGGVWNSVARRGVDERVEMQDGWVSINVFGLEVRTVRRGG